jgi:hypothetical protein
VLRINGGGINVNHWRRIHRRRFAQKVSCVVVEAIFYTKSELGATATSRSRNFPEIEPLVHIL